MKLSPRFHINTLKTKLLLPIIGVVFIGLLIMVFTSYRLAQEIIEENSEQLSEAKANKLASIIEIQLDTWSGQIQSLSLVDAIADMDLDTLSEHIENRESIYEDFLLFYQSDTSGLAMPTKGARVDISGTAYFKEALKGHTVISDPVVFGTVITPVITITTPIYDKTGSVQGVMGGAISLSHISDFINTESYGKTGYAFMISQTGLFIAYPGQDDHKLAALSRLAENYYKNTSPSLSNALHAMQNEKNGTTYYQAGSLEKRAAYARIRQTGWSVAVSISTNEVLQSLRTLRTKSIFLGGVIIIFMVSVLYYTISHHLISPLKTLQFGTEKYGEGQLHWRISLDTSDEFQDLASKFNLMAMKLESMIAERDKISASLKENNTLLEMRVEARTHELAEINAELKSSNADLSTSNQALADEIDNRMRIEHTLHETNEQLKLTLDTLKRTQSSLIIHEKMGALGNMVMGIAHELNTPVGICITTLSYLEKIHHQVHAQFEQNALSTRLFSEYIEESNTSIETIKRSLQRTDLLIQAFKKLSAGKDTDRIEHIEIRDFLQESFNHHNVQLSQAQIELEINCPENTTLYTYENALFHVISVLTHNALVHGLNHSSGEKNIRVDIEPLQDGIKMIFSDNGIGIAPDTLKEIFTPFFTTNRAGGSVGLGLSVVYNLVTQRMGGHITVESEPRQGTRFFIDLPNNYG